MKFLIDNDLPPWMVAAFAEQGYEAVHTTTVSLDRAPDPVIGEFAQNAGWSIVTGDFDFADIRNYNPADFEGIVVLEIPRYRGSVYMRILLEKLFDYLRTPHEIAGKLLIVTPERIRVRE